jgi:hypothetical protein
MKPRFIGRTLGIGLRVAGRVVAQRVGADSASAGAQVGAPAVVVTPENIGLRAAAQGRAAGEAVGTTTRGVGRGIAGLVKPFGRVAGILWLEVMGACFLIFVAAFLPTLWRTRASYAHGPDHRTFLAAAFIVTLFLCLSVRSFWKARKR